MSITGIINEEWRSISEYGNYQVSNIGRVKNVETHRILKPNILPNDYYRICLYKEKARSMFYIHRLVAQEFIENPDNKDFVDHINRKRNDNTILNLRWVTGSENQMNKSIQQNGRSKYKGVCIMKTTNKWKAQIRLGGQCKHLGYYTNEKEAAAKYNEAAIEHFGEHALFNEISSDEEEEDEDGTDDVQIYT